MSWIGFESDYIILLFFLIQLELDPFKFVSKNLDPYTTQPDPTYVK
jgi:hypothetical protein